MLEGRVALALKNAGASDEEIARRTAAVSKGEEPPPPGVSFDFGAEH